MSRFRQLSGAAFCFLILGGYDGRFCLVWATMMGVFTSYGRPPYMGDYSYTRATTVHTGDHRTHGRLGAFTSYGRPRGSPLRVYLLSLISYL